MNTTATNLETATNNAKAAMIAYLTARREYENCGGGWNQHCPTNQAAHANLITATNARKTAIAARFAALNTANNETDL